MLTNLAKRHIRAKLENSLMCIKGLNDFKVFKLSKMVENLENSHSRIKKNTLHKIFRVGKLPPRKNLNVYNKPNINQLLNTFK